MNARTVLTAAGAALTCVLLAGCGAGNGGTSMSPAPPTQPGMPPAMTLQLDTAAVLAIVQTKTSETAEPFEVDDFAVALIPVGDETSPPMGVDAT